MAKCPGADGKEEGGFAMAVPSHESCGNGGEWVGAVLWLFEGALDDVLPSGESPPPKGPSGSAVRNLQGGGV